MLKRTTHINYGNRHESGLNGRFSLVILRLFVSIFLLSGFSSSGFLSAQVVALKTNLLYDATASANLAFEVKLADRWTLGAGAGLNLWNPVKSSDSKEDLPPKWRHVLVNVEARYWFCSVFVRDFIGINAVYSHFNATGDGYPVGWAEKMIYTFGTTPAGSESSVADTRKQGDMVAAGVFYGWSWILSPHISLELEAGLDVGHAWYDEYACQRCGPLLEKKEEWFLAPKLGVNFIWQIK
ncbi:MAG: DUF3575 domain-containing protein [Paludibacteraceae bacterium]|nr:DUF3575 domain-containing protein [Paludibacteraceae bacterium]